MRRPASAGIAFLLAACGSGKGRAPGGLEDVAAASGVLAGNRYGSAEKRSIFETVGAGAAWLDFDGDGDLDLFLTNGSPRPDGAPDPATLPALFRNDGGGFRDVTAGSGLDVPRWWVGAAVGDFDGDGDPDLFVTAFGPDALFRNRTERGGPPRFEASACGVEDSRWGASASFLDADLDGDLDLYVANYLRIDPTDPAARRTCDWKGIPAFCGPRGFEGAGDAFFRNEGDGRFAPATREAGLDPGLALFALGTVAGDFDGDGDPDLYVANDRCRNFHFRNSGDGTFVEVGYLDGTAYGPLGEEHGSMGVDFGDADGDGDFELFVTNFEDENNDFYRNDGAFFLEVSAEVGLDRPSRPLVGWGTRFCDLDLDGDEDLFVAYGHVYPQADRRQGPGYRQRAHLYRNEGGRFLEASDSAGAGLSIARSSRGVAFGDYDGDGDEDILVANLDDSPTLLRNSLASGPWIGFRLLGVRSNRDAYGVRVALDAGGRRQVKESHADGSIFSSSDARLVFGLGSADRVDAATVRWPSGREERAGDLEVGRYHLWIEGAGVVGGSARR
ncbi:MAG TPA: FG-GAP-like repeat-containing protein [Planctomycetota bacterium]|jgi:hypothetical protein|nr:FG-GAP-like repeat-containing protein [Planctomycetota bacterium]